MAGSNNSLASDSPEHVLKNLAKILEVGRLSIMAKPSFLRRDIMFPLRLNPQEVPEKLLLAVLAVSFAHLSMTVSPEATEITGAEAQTSLVT